MGEIAEAIMDGIMCEICGVYLGEPTYAPTKCNTCQEEDEE